MTSTEYRNDLHQQYDSAIPAHEIKILAAMQAEERKEAKAQKPNIDENTRTAFWSIEGNCASAIYFLKSIQEKTKARQPLSYKELNELHRLAGHVAACAREIENCVVGLMEV